VIPCNPLVWFFFFLKHSAFFFITEKQSPKGLHNQKNNTRTKHQIQLQRTKARNRAKRPSLWTRDKKSLPTKLRKPSLKQLPNGRLWNRYNNIQITTNKQRSQNTSSGKKRQPKSACVKHTPSPGTPKTMDGLHERRSAPPEARETSCGPHANEPEELNRRRVRVTHQTKTSPHGLVERPSWSEKADYRN